MNNLLIVGAGIYANVAAEVAVDMGCFEKIVFVDDNKMQTPSGAKVIGTTKDINQLACEFANIFVAIGNSEIRLALLEKIMNETECNIVTLISPCAYVSPDAKLEKGCIVEPMAVVHTGCRISMGCIISAGAVVNHASVCEEGVHVDCNATVAGYSVVPKRTKVYSGTVFLNQKG